MLFRNPRSGTEEYKHYQRRPAEDSVETDSLDRSEGIQIHCHACGYPQIIEDGGHTNGVIDAPDDINKVERTCTSITSTVFDSGIKRVNMMS